MKPEFVKAWTIEWEWLVFTAIVGLAVALIVKLKLKRWMYHNLNLDVDSPGAAIANIAPTYISLLIILFTVDIICESALHLPRIWYYGASIGLLAFALLLCIAMVVHIKKELYRIRYAPVHSRRRRKAARRDLQKQ